MKNRIIESYINKMTKNDIIKFAEKNSIILNDFELDYIYNEIKKNGMNLLYSKPDFIISSIKANLSQNNCDKVILLYKEYYKKYKSYL